MNEKKQPVCWRGVGWGDIPGAKATERSEGEVTAISASRAAERLWKVRTGT